MGGLLVRGKCMPQWVTLCLLLLLTGSASAKNVSRLEQKYPIEQANQQNRRFSIFSDSPTATFLSRNEDFKEEIDPMLDLLRGIVRGVDKERTKVNKTRACNLRSNFPNWVYTARLNSRFFQVGKLSTNCYTRIDGDDCIRSEVLSAEEVSKSPETIGKGVEALYRALDRTGEDWPSRLGRANWSETHHLRDWKNQDLSEECKVETFSAYRKNGELYLRAAMTNHDVDKYLKEGDRQFVMEWVKEDYSTSLTMVQPNYRDCEMEDGSTMLWTRSGRAWLSWHGEMREGTNPALQKVIAANEVEIDLAEDAVAAANIALLALPLVMTLIPVAFLAELNTCGFLWYVIFTDIISAVPLLIKGAELVRTTHSRSALVSYYAGDEELADIQVWVASCNGTKIYRNIGISFIVISVTAILGGIALELFATKYMQNKRENEDSSTVEGPFGKAMFEITALGLLGTGHGENWERYSETLNLSESDGEGDSPAENKESWRKWIFRVLSSASRVANPATPAKQLSYPSTFRGYSESMFAAGVGKDGMSSAERVDLGVSPEKYMYDEKK
ncbi:hypothetical protein FGB62_93g037 [Gracilaria domingensis]|nr:hypothetical protein FGB62_93g037 [Gracilaria domingensis]